MLPLDTLFPFCIYTGLLSVLGYFGQPMDEKYRKDVPDLVNYAYGNILISITLGTWCHAFVIEENHKTILYTILQVVGLVVLSEIWFYSTHYVCHVVPWLYKWVHKTHHRFNIPVALTTFYCSPVEMIVVNSGTAMVPTIILYLLGFPLTIQLYRVWVISGIVFGVTSHSYEDQKHTVHHKRRDVEYGYLFMDWLFGTASDHRGDYRGTLITYVSLAASFFALYWFMQFELWYCGGRLRCHVL